MSKSDSLMTHQPPPDVPTEVTEGIPLYDSGGAVTGHIVTIAYDQPANPTATCWRCGRADPITELYKPCDCPTLVHRSCFRTWRQGWINPRNYFSCPQCMRSYNIERVRPATTESTAAIRRQYTLAVLKLWLAIIVVIASVLFALGGISYAADRPFKNIPVGIKFMLTSAIAGFPNANSTAVWRAEFASPSVAVWPYYSIFSLFVASVLVLTIFSCIGCTLDERDRRFSRCTCCDRDACDCTLIACYDPCPTYACYGQGGHCCDGCDCGNCNCNNCDCHNCGNCDCKGGGGGGDGAAVFLIVVVLVVAAIVIVSAIFVVVAFAVTKTTLLYDRMANMLKHQAEELEGETIVLGVNETWRPTNAV